MQLGNPRLRAGTREQAVRAAAKARRAAERARDVRPYIEAARTAGCTSLQTIADALNARGIPSARGTAPMTRRPAGRGQAAPPAPPGRCYGYARVSTVQQASEGESLDVQQRVIAGYATMHDLTIDKVFVERGVSGSKPLGDRPQGAALLAMLKASDTIITPKLGSPADLFKIVR